MVNEDIERNSDCEMGVVLESEALNDGSVIEIDNGVGGEGNSAGSSGNHFTYSRRKRAKKITNSAEKLLGDWNSDSQVTDKVSSLFGFLQTMKEPNLRLHSSSCNQASHVRMDSHASTNVSHDCSVKDWRKVVLEQMYQSLNETEGGLQDCIRDALVYCQEGSCTSTIKEAVRLGEKMHFGACNASKDPVGVTLNGSTNESAACLNSELCKHALFSVLTSTKFAKLCDLLFGNFHGIKVNSLFDLGLINSRINEGAYKNSPTLFHSDIQQVWTKLRKVGNEMATLAMSLSEMSRASCHDKFHVQETNVVARVEQTEGCCRRAYTCRHCEEKAEDRDCLACEICEDIYHVSCIESVHENSRKRWRCAKCRLKGFGLRHEYCVLCESINAPRSSCTGIDGLVANDKELELEESSDYLEQDGLVNGEAIFPRCKICGNDIGTEDVRICGHSFCPSKYYHTRCLTGKQQNTYGSCWYCPSCLCRGCLTDQDDDKIVLCDGCDQAFHIYCMQPPHTSIPKGKWFCTKCNEGILRIHKAKTAYTSAIKRAERENGADENSLQIVRKEMDEGLDTPVGVDMLLNAAKTLNNEDSLTAVGYNL